MRTTDQAGMRTTNPPRNVTTRVELGPVQDTLLLLLLIAILRRLGILPVADPPDVASIAELLAHVAAIDQSRLAESQLWADRLAAGNCVVTV